VDAITESIAVEREVVIAASPETVWELLVDPEQAQRWMGQSATFELRPGGRYRVEVIPGHTASGEFVEIDPPRRLVHTWGWERDDGSSVAPGSTTVEYELVPNGEGTLLRFSHRNLPGSEASAPHAHGWDHYLERLAAVAAGGNPGIDPWISGSMQ
jgi:uncharacterized protein YndB with AHSA1/START domain